MDLYSRWILPRLLDLTMQNHRLDPYRHRAIEASRGLVLEIGVGSGLNLPLYGRAVDRVCGIDLSLSSCSPGAVLWAVRAARSNLCNSPPSTAKLWCGQGGMGAESFGFVGRVSHGNSTAHHLESNLLVFKDIDMKRAEEASALIGERTSSTPLNFALGTAQRRPNCRARIGE
jgi:hypothetical protein